MSSNPLLGVFFHWLGGLESASFYVPYKRVRGWSWEVYWLTGGLFSWVIAPWVFATLRTQHLWQVLMSAPTSTLVWCWVWGALVGFRRVDLRTHHALSRHVARHGDCPRAHHGHWYHRTGRSFTVRSRASRPRRAVAGSHLSELRSQSPASSSSPERDALRKANSLSSRVGQTSLNSTSRAVFWWPSSRDS